MGGGIALLILVGLAFFASLAFTGFMRQVGVSDVPNKRSAHSAPIPTSGGVGILAGLGMCLLALPYLLPELTTVRETAPFLSLIFAVAVLGLTDDIFLLKSGMKMFLLVIMAGLAVWVIGPADLLPTGKAGLQLPFSLAFIGSVLWLFTVTNGVNFMDGSNGLMGVVMAIASFALVGIGFAVGAATTSVLALILFGSILGFLPYNFRPKAQLFCGDVGSLTIGFTYAGLVLSMIQEADSAAIIYAGPLLILPFLADVLLTLLRRAVKGEPVLLAHNTHLYQRLIRSGRSHMQIAWVYGFVTLVLGNLVLIALTKGWMSSPWLLIALSLVLTGLYAVLSKKLPN